MSSSQSLIKVYISYASEDKKLVTELLKHLKPLKKQERVCILSNQLISGGANRVHGIHALIEQASIILLLISPDFWSSDDCSDVEMKRALERAQAGEAYVIPILLRPVENGPDAPFGQLQVLPTNNKPITTWKNRDEAFVDVVQSISRSIDALHISSPNASSITRSRPRIYLPSDNIPLITNILKPAVPVALIALLISLFLVIVPLLQPIGGGQSSHNTSISSSNDKTNCEVTGTSGSGNTTIIKGSNNKSAVHGICNYNFIEGNGNSSTIDESTK